MTPIPSRLLDRDEFGYPADTLGMSPEDMRRLGYKVVDLVVERLMRKNTEPVIVSGQADHLIELLGGPLPEEALDAEESLDLLARTVLTHQQHGDHPRYFARVPGPCSFAGILGEWMGTGFNTISSTWTGSSGPSTVELISVDWLRQMIGLPDRTEGVLVSGGSIANLTAFATARSELGPGVAYVTDQTHSSLLRNLLELGFRDSCVNVLPSDRYHRMSTDSLRQAISRDKKAGLRPLMVIATAGTTNTGVSDPLDAIADICESEAIWFHIDGAYGAPAAVTEQGREYLLGMERADSLVLDPHKWFFQPYDIGACLVTRPGALERCFSMSPEYLKDVQPSPGEVNLCNRSLELTRRSRALKLWMSIRTYGAAQFRKAVQRGMELAEFAEARLREQPDVWEIVTPAQLGIVCFALKNDKPGEHQDRAQALSESGFACVSSTMLKDRSVLRLCTINPLTTEDDIVETLLRLG